MRIALCDDDPKDLARMKDFLGRARSPSAPSSEIFTFDHPDALLNAARRSPFDLYLLDIVMNHLTGIQLVDELRKLQQNPCVIFFSTSRDYAYEAFQLKAVTYVAKPFSRERFEAALADALARLEKDAAQYLTLGKGGEMHRFRADTIEYVTPADAANYARLHLADGTTVETRYGLAAFAKDQEKLVPLVLLGRALLVNPALVNAVNGTRVTFFSGHTLDIPSRTLRDLREALLSCTGA